VYIDGVFLVHIDISFDVWLRVSCERLHIEETFGMKYGFER
jgi:hypothetical protein